LDWPYCPDYRAKTSVAGRNLDAAKKPTTRKTTSAHPCAMRNGGSDCVRASGCSAGTFWNDCTIKTRTLKYSAAAAAVTEIHRHGPTRCFAYNAIRRNTSTKHETY